MKSFYRLLKYITPYWGHGLMYIVFTVFGVLFSLVSITMLIPFLSLLFGKQELVTEVSKFSFNVDSILQHFSFYLSSIIIEKGKVDALIFICIMVTTMVLLKNLFTYLAMFFMAPLRYKVIRDLRNSVYDKLLRLPLAYYSDERKGDIMSKMSNDIQDIEISVVTSLSAFFKEPLTIIAFLGAMFYISPQITLMILFILPISGFMINKIARSLKRHSVRTQEKTGFLLSMIEETLGGLRIIKAFAAEKFILNKFKDQNNQLHHIQIGMLRRRDLSSPISEFLGVAVLVLVMYYGGRMVLGEDAAINAATFITYLGIFAQVISPAKAFSNAFYNIVKGTASLERIEKILFEPLRIEDSKNAKDIHEFKSEIEFKNIGFSYADQEVLKEINLKVPKGHTVALVGQSGAGKSTMADLLPRFYDVKSGGITIDGVNVKDIKMQSLVSLMGIVSQEAILFNDTIFNNIAFGIEDATLEAVMEAAKIANAHDFIMQTENGYETVIGDRGGRLSGGQRQRLSIARAVMKNPPILILDEATSALDTESERLVQDALEALMASRTTLVIAHRLSTIQHANLIAVMFEGEIVETGTHDQLIKKKGNYYKLFKMQSFN